MAYRYTVPATNGKLKHKLRVGKKDSITEWTIFADRVTFVSNNRQKELDKRKDVVVEELKEE